MSDLQQAIERLAAFVKSQPVRPTLYRRTLDDMESVLNAARKMAGFDLDRAMSIGWCVRHRRQEDVLGRGYCETGQDLKAESACEIVAALIAPERTPE